MKHVKILAGLLLMLLMVFSGCAPKNAATKAAPAKTVTVTDDAGRKVEIPTHPKRVVCLSNSYLSLLEVVQGDLVGVVSAKAAHANIPERYAQLPSVGEVYNVNMESLVGLKPDLVLAAKGSHEKLLPILDSNHVPVLLLSLKSFAEVEKNMLLFGKIYGQEEKAAAENKKLETEIADITSKIPAKPLKVAIIHATPSNVTVELEGSIAGDVSRRLGFTNVAAGSSPLKNNSNRTPYSMETLVAKDPDVIFVTSMGEASKIQARLQKDVESNPAWNSLRAVQEHKFYVLPENLFLLNPGLDYPQAVSYMAKVVYPQLFDK